MTDFVQTMKDWRRLCRTMEAEHHGDGCDHCPLLDISPDGRGCDAIYADEFADSVDWRRLEEAVDIWAQANPEPVYPTWREYLESSQGMWLAASGAMRDDWISNTNIPADIAQKLGVEPKEAQDG